MTAKLGNDACTLTCPRYHGVFAPASTLRARVVSRRLALPFSVI